MERPNSGDMRNIKIFIEIFNIPINNYQTSAPADLINSENFGFFLIRFP
jgi:hypothetical protein